ncbi:hypothetical protein HWV62_23428 [Athelia sp. TMB]|nr:hypothetical protein HWV62_23428 [Athelia sp. TMB]
MEDREYQEMKPMERVLMDHGNISIVDLIFDELDICDIIAIGSTCKRGRLAWQGYRERVFNLNKFLSVYVHNTTIFRSVIRATDSIITGSCVTDFLRRTHSGSRPLTIVAKRYEAWYILDFLEEVEGYDEWTDDMMPGGSFSPPIGYTWREGSTTGREGLRSGFLSTKAKSRTEHPIRDLLTLEKIDSEGRSKFIVLTIATTCVTKTILSPRTTAAANVMTADTIVSLFPSVTFKAKLNFTITRSIPQRLWNTPVITTERMPAKEHADTSDYKVLNVREGKNPERAIGDSECWVLMYDAEGNNIEPHHGSDACRTLRELRENKWRIRMREGRIFMDVESAKLSVNEEKQ